MSEQVKEGGVVTYTHPTSNERRTAKVIHYPRGLTSAGCEVVVLDAATGERYAVPLADVKTASEGGRCPG